MKCKQCGGNLIIRDGVYLCESCGAKYSVTDYYEDIDTYICYIESDHAGRRTKDSIIAQDLYQKLEANKIKSFYSRISASDLTGELYEKACNAALFTAKTVIIIGTSKENFESLLNHYESLYTGKIVIPVFSEMDPYDIPKNISAIQALNYNKIGADIDLIKSILNALGRSQEADRLTANSKHTGKKCKKVVWSIIIVAVVMLVAGFLVFGTDLFFKQADEAPIDPQLMQYNEAVASMEEGEYSKAIELFYNLTGYKDSDRQLQILYERYAGYYKDDESGVTIHFQIFDGNTANIDITSVVDGKQIRITESSLCQAAKAEFDFNDSENNQGTVSIKLENEEIRLTIVTYSNSNSVSIGNIELVFPLAAKSDKPFATQIDKNTLLSFLQTYTTLSDLRRKGFELELDHSTMENRGFDTYIIQNTDIILAALMDADTSDSFVFAISAPASIICPERVGKNNDVFLEDNVLYLPDLSIMDHFLSLSDDTADVRTIENDTMISFASTLSLDTAHDVAGGFTMDELKQYYFIEYQAMREYNNRYSLEFSGIETLEDTDSYRIVSVYDYQNNFPTENYKIDKRTFQMEEFVPEEYDPALEEGPNVWCPNCGLGFYTTGIGNDSLTCRECGCVWLPMCYLCNAQDAVSIKSADDGQFVCNKCGGAWNP